MLALRRAISASPRAYSTAALSPPVIYASTSNDPWFNLSYEDWLLRNTPATQPVLFTYRNAPCVVIGRNQNPWTETNPRALVEMGLPLVRRRSGGGTVYHDMGNTNFSIMTPREVFTRSAGAYLVAAAVRERLSVPACTVNERNDVVIREQGTKDGELKVSGSAYKIISHRAYHHGTMLISSDLSTLGAALRSDSPNMETKGVGSVRAPVSTINAHRTGKEIGHEAFVRAVQAQFVDEYGPPERIVAVSEASVGEAAAKVDAGIADLKSWDWQIGQTPEFTNRLAGELSFGHVTAFIHSRHALVVSLVLELSAPNPSSEIDLSADEVQDVLDAIALGATGTRYASLEGAEGNMEFVRPDVAYEVLAWLRGAM